MRTYQVIRNYTLSLFLASSSVACQSSVDHTAPQITSDRPNCILSADCPSGTHCDLEECTQDCNDTDPCTGQKTCSPRARCLAPDAPDEDPAPSTVFLGTLHVTPNQVALTGDTGSFSIQLTTDSLEPVRYRVQLLGPHLEIAEPRGEFTGTTSIPIRVDPSKLQGRDVAGTVKIFTTLGNAVVDAPIHVGLTGTYGGSLRYDGGPVDLGDARIALDLIENHGDVQIRVDSHASLLFPPTGAGETTGHGSYTVTDGVDVTLAQLVDASFGADRNHFLRPIGRKVRLQLKPTARGDLDGTVTETIFGLFSGPITTTGHVHLEYHPQGSDPSFMLADDPVMPEGLPTPVGPDKIFGWSSTCEAAVGCGGKCDAKAIADAEAKYAEPLNDTIVKSNDNGAASVSPIQDIADACLQAITATSVAGANSCGLMVPLACGLRLATKLPARTTANDILAGRMVAEAFAPALLVAKNDVVNALTDSFAQGPVSERAQYDAAMKALGPMTTWITQPDILEFLRTMSAATAKGDGATTQDYPAARALADVFVTATMIDGERSRIAGAMGSADGLAADVQRRAVLGYLEAVTLNELLHAWAAAPSSLKAAFTGMLGPLDRGFADMLNGANVFGVPAGYVPFVYRPEDIAKGSTNFEQMLSLASVSVGAEKILEANFLEDKRTYEANVAKLQAEIANVRIQFDTKLKDSCGTNFDPDSIARAEDWALCGADGTGDIGVLMLDVQAADARIASAQSRALGQKEKISIDYRALAASQATHKQTLNFITSTGRELATLAFAEGTIDAIQQSIQVASHASLWNAGAPLAEAAVHLALGMEKAAIEKQRTELQTAQSLQYERASAQREYIDGMAAIQKEMVDLAQMSVDVHQDLINKLQSVLRVQNLLDQARMLLQERGRVLVAASQDPANTASFRLLRDRNALQTLDARAEAQRQLYMAARSLEYEINMSIGVDGAVMNAHDATSLERLQLCLTTIFGQSRTAYGPPQDYVTTVSVRKMLGITGPRTDSVTGQTLSEAEQFRQLLLKNENLDGRGGVGVYFATDLQPGNQLWSADVCADRLASVQAQLVGDFLGDNQAQVNLLLSGGSVLRSCDSDMLQTWSLGGAGRTDQAAAVIQAGVNSFGDAPPNTSLFGQAVARASWRLVIPGSMDAPSNSDVDLTHVDDIVLKFTHKAAAKRSSPLDISLSCLSGVGP